VSTNSVCNSKTDVCSDVSAKCCAGSAADYLQGVTKCLTTCYAPVAQWNDCNSQKDLCATSGDFCCFGSADDFKSAKTTCRPSGNCYKPPPLQPDASFQGGYN